MVPDWLARLVAARHAPEAGVALLALAAVAQAAAQFAVAGGERASDGTVQAVFSSVPVCLLALAATVPLLFLRPAAAAITIAAANALLLAWFGEATVAGVLAQLIAAYRVGAGAEGPVRDARWADRTSPASRAGRASATEPADGAGTSAASRSVLADAVGAAGDVIWGEVAWEDWLRRVPGARRASVWARAGAQYLGVVLSVPFLALALAGRGGAAAVLLAWSGPAAAGAGIAVRARREARTRTAAGEALADTMLAHTARGERARIARELHDVVAHHISMVAVQAETARLTTPGLPAAGAHRFAEIGDTARAGLTEMRRLLGVLREDAADAGATVADRHPLPGLPQLAELVDAARDASGAGIRLIVSGPVTEFDPGVELAAYRIVQEALTNARRHAPSVAVDVELCYADDALRLRVRDNGPGPEGSPETPGTESYPPADLAGGGHGLLGMRERTLAVGGTLWTGSAPGGGFLVEAVLPAKPEVAGLRTQSSRAEAAQ
ncbi:MAG TPA: histidine kinase [Trebonia sp.]|nr:histidine kinase [Trebonia sp.]